MVMTDGNSDRVFVFKFVFVVVMGVVVCQACAVRILGE